MQRKAISESEYTAVLNEIVITRMHTYVMSLISGKHIDYGRVVLIQSGTSFVIIADHLPVFWDKHDDAGLARAVASRVESPDAVMM